jgi:diguanylate cyclase (GGDEF)-like protein
MRALSLLSDVVSENLGSTEALVRCQRCFGRAAESATTTLIRQAEAEANTDVLTGLGGRGAYDIDLAGAVRRVVDENHGAFALANLDVNGLRIVNNEVSHIAGDTYLKHFAVVLADAVGLHDARAYHVSGDEFAVLFRDGTIESASAVLSELRSDARCPPVSFGVAECPRDGLAREELELLADERMKAMKSEEPDPARFARTRAWLNSPAWKEAQESA